MGAVTVRTSIRGWNFEPNEFAEGTGRLIRAKDGASILASTDNRLWEEQIHDFEFIDGEQWTTEQIAAMKPAIDLHRHLTINELLACFPGCACLRCARTAPFAMPLVYTDTDRISRHRSPPAAEIPVIPGMQEITRKQFLEICGPDAELEPGWAYGTDNGGITITSRYTPPDEIPVTDEMTKEADREGFCMSNESYAAIYRAMRPLDRSSITMACANILGQRIAYLEAVVANMPTADSVKEMLDGKDAEIALLRQALAMKDARIGELKSVLASTPVAFEDPDAKPEPEINPFRNFGHDPRRMGP